MLRDKVEDVLKRIRPSLHVIGGDVQLVDVDQKDGIVRIKLQGNCASCHMALHVFCPARMDRSKLRGFYAGCPMTDTTLKMRVEKALQKEVPEVNRVESV